jgi:hypothetical protein
VSEQAVELAERLLDALAEMSNELHEVRAQRDAARQANESCLAQMYGAKRELERAQAERPEIAGEHWRGWDSLSEDDAWLVDRLSDDLLRLANRDARYNHEVLYETILARVSSWLRGRADLRAERDEAREDLNRAATDEVVANIKRVALEADLIGARAERDEAVAANEAAKQFSYASHRQRAEAAESALAAVRKVVDDAAAFGEDLDPEKIIEALGEKGEEGL